MKNIITILILLIFSLECAGMEDIASMFCPKSCALRPQAAAISSLDFLGSVGTIGNVNQGNTQKASSAGNSSKKQDVSFDVKSKEDRKKS